MGFALFIVCNSIRLSAFSYWNIANLDANLATKLDTEFATDFYIPSSKKEVMAETDFDTSDSATWVYIFLMVW